MPYGLNKATNYYNRLEAWRDWLALSGEATANGYGDLVTKYQPLANAGWRKIDKSIARLRGAMQERKQIENEKETTP